MKSSDNPNRGRVEKERIQLLSRIDQFCSRGPKHLDTEPRLHAALYIRQQFESLIRPKGSLRVAELEAKLGSNGLSGIRIHRWMVRASEREINEEMIKYYKNRPEPLKKTKTYFELAAALARIGGDDPVEAKIALFRRTGLDTLPLGNDATVAASDFDASNGLLQLLRRFASDTAYRLDLGHMFDSTERLQAGWSPHNEGSVFIMSNALQPYSRRTIFSGFWLMDEIPALPTVRLAEFPLATLYQAKVHLGSDPASLKTLTGTLRATWSLRLAIVPDGRAGVAPCLLRTTRLYFEPEPGTSVADEGRWEIRHYGDGLEDLWIDERGRIPHVSHDPSLQIRFAEDTVAHYETLRETLYIRTKPDESLPHEGIPCAMIEPLDLARFRLWFRDGAGREDEEIERAPVLAYSQVQTDGDISEWFNTPCLARDLELAVRDGSLRAQFKKAASEMRRSLQALEKQRIAQMGEIDRQLLETWAAERAVMDIAVENGPTPLDHQNKDS